MHGMSVCTIMKDEEENLPAFLEAVLKYGFEMVLVDTGSSDKSIEIATKHGCMVHRYVWKNNFSDARNFAASKAKNDIIIALDCDEIIKSINVDELNKQISGNSKGLGLIRIINYMQKGTEAGAYYDRIARIYDRRYFCFEGNVHEQIRPINKDKSEIEGYQAAVEVIHTGYIIDGDKSAEKHKRNIQLLKSGLNAEPQNVYLHFQMGQELYTYEDYEAAEIHFKYVLDNAELKKGIEAHRLSVMGYGDCLLHMNRPKDALAIREYVNLFGYTPDIHFLMGVIYYLNYDFLNAMQEFVFASSMDNPAKEGTNTYLPRYYLGLINEQFGQLNEARSFYVMCGDYPPALERLEIMGN